MKRLAPCLLWLLGLVLCLGWIAPLALDVAAGHDRSLDHAFDSVALQMPRQEVAKRMGSNGRFNRKFYLAQRAGYDREYAEADRCGASYYLSWSNEPDWCYTVGFDAGGRVVYMAQGGT